MHTCMYVRARALTFVRVCVRVRMRSNARLPLSVEDGYKNLIGVAYASEIPDCS